MLFGQHTPTETVHGGRGRGMQFKFRFDNGFGASVIDDGYGRERGLFELAVLDWDGRLTYDTPITSDVIGYLTADGVGGVLDRIEGLAAEVTA